MKLSIIVPVYYNEDNLIPLYEDIKNKIFDAVDFDCEMIMVDDGSGDNSYKVMEKLASEDDRIKIIGLSRNFGSHAACLCGLAEATGDCAVIKAADLQEPTELILDMVESWKTGNNVVLAVRESREEKASQVGFANLYYWMVKKFALSNMPDGGFDIYLLDKKVINVLLALDEKNSAITGQILWSGFKTGIVPYVRKSREIGKSRWTLKKKIRLVTNTLFSFSTIPIKIVTTLGLLSFLTALIWTIVVFVERITNRINVTGWTTMFIFNLFSFGITMVSIGIIGEYIWRTFDASRNRPTYIIERRWEKKDNA